MVSRQNPRGLGDNYGSGRKGTGHGPSQSDKDRASGRKGKDTPAQNANKAARNNTNQSRRKGGK